MRHSAEVLRAFYLIAINKDRDVPDSQVHRDEYRLEADDAFRRPRDQLPLLISPGQSPQFELVENTTKGGVTLATANDNGSLESNLGHTEAGASRLKLRLKNPVVAWNDSACQHCQLYGLSCDLQRPSCWKCQRHSIPCYYEAESVEDYQHIEPAFDSEDELTSWQDSVRVNPYHNLEGKRKLHRIGRQYLPPKRGRLSKPMPREKRELYDKGEPMKEDEESLLGEFSLTNSTVDLVLRPSSPALSEVNTTWPTFIPTTSEVEMALPTASSTTFRIEIASRSASPTNSDAEMASRTPVTTSIIEIAASGLEATFSKVEMAPKSASPNGSRGSELVRPFCRPKSSVGSGFITSLASTESRTTKSSLVPSSTPPTTGYSSVRPPQSAEGPSDNALKQFWCTFCLNQCNDQNEWEQHEQFQHYPQKLWVCMPWGPAEKLDDHDVCVFCDVADPDSDHFREHTVHYCWNENGKVRTFTSEEALQQHLLEVHNQTKMTQNMQSWSRSPTDNEWYWNCGFCDTQLTSWTDRVLHIGDHFNEGAVMYCWDPLSPPYPIDRATLDRAAGFPLTWDSRTLWDLEPKHSGYPPVRACGAQNRCKKCDINFSFRNDADVKRHESIWHSRREVWLCHMMKNIAADILAPYFFPHDGYAFGDSKCPYCGKLFARLAEPGRDLRDVISLHLEDDHNLNGCDSHCVYQSRANLSLHLANSHNLSWNDMTFDVIESCRRDNRPLDATVKCDS